MSESHTWRGLTAATCLLFLIRSGLALARTGPLVVADETGYLTNARVLVGGEPGSMQIASFSRGGYSLLLAPLVALHLDPETTYRLILVLNAVLAASLLPLVHLLLTRCFRVSPRRAFWPAIAGATYPSVTAYSQVALAENLLLPLTVVWLICFGGLLDARDDRRRMLWAGAVGFVGAALYAVHGRMLVTLAVTLVGSLILLLRRRLPVGSAVTAALVAVLGFWGTNRFDDFLISRNYGGRAPNEIGVRLVGLASVGGVASAARDLIGQSWYVVVATLGVLVVFVFQGGLRPLRTIGDGGAETPPLVLALLCSTGLGLLVVSALSFRTFDRPDVLIYGRYVEVIVPPFLAVALSYLGAERRRVRHWRALAIVAVATAVIAGLRSGIHPPRAANRWNVASLPFLTMHLGPQIIAGAGAVTALSIVLVSVMTLRCPAVIAPVVAVLFVPITAVVENNPVISGEHAVYPAGWTSPESAARNAAEIDYDMDHYDVFGLFAYQWFLPRSRYVLFSSSRDSPSVRYVLSGHSFARQHPSLQARPLWSDPGRDQTLFLVPDGPPSRAKAAR